jgi:hypothetical protein
LNRDLDTTRFRTWASERQQYVSRLDPSDIRSTEDGFSSRELGDNYVLSELKADGSDGQIQLEVAVATYGEIIRSCDALLNEYALLAYLVAPKGPDEAWPLRFLRWLANPARLTDRALLRRLPWRRRAHQSGAAGRIKKWAVFRDCDREAENLFIKPRGRAAGLGIAVATVVEESPGDWRVLLAERAANVGTYPFAWHVAPAGMCNTEGTDEHDSVRGPGAISGAVPWYLETQMRCELVEELGARDELRGYQGHRWQERVDYLCAAQFCRPINFDLTGVSFDLLNLRPEICAVAKLTLPQMENRFLNSEYLRRNNGHLYRLRRDAGDRMGRGPAVASGAAAVSLASAFLAS